MLYTRETRGKYGNGNIRERTQLKDENEGGQESVRMEESRKRAMETPAEEKQKLK